MTREEIIKFFKERVKISSGDYAEKIGGTTKTASRHLSKLIEEGILGSTYSGAYPPNFSYKKLA